MKCPKCGYHSFDHLDSCKRCGKGLVGHKEKFNLRGYFTSGQKAATDPESVGNERYKEEAPSADGTIDFGFDFLEEEEEPVREAAGGKNGVKDKSRKGSERANV